eukprot:3771395-Rhodomonas_salina.1
MYQECGFLYLITQCTSSFLLRLLPFSSESPPPPPSHGRCQRRSLPSHRQRSDLEFIVNLHSQRPRDAPGRDLAAHAA